jgi:hypothetical protein
LALSAILTLVSPGALATPLGASPTGSLATASAPAEWSADAHHVWQWALDSGDTHGQPFAVVDKKAARVYVFAADGRLIGSDHALLGQAPGDHSVPGVADGDVNRIPLADRTTPAGRFASQPGRNLTGELIVWFDYNAALAIHRVRPGGSQAQRLQQIASATPTDNRASLGCVVVTPEFYDAVVQPVLGRQRGVVYVLPEREPVQAYFGSSPLVAGR